MTRKLMLVAGLAALLAACSSDDPMEPETTSEPEPIPQPALAPAAPAAPSPAAVTLAACTHHWANGSSGPWFTAGNWSPATVPGPSSTACIDAPGTYAVTLDPPVDATPVDLDGLSVGGGASGAQTLLVKGTAATINVAQGVDVKANGVFSLEGFNGVVVTAGGIANAGTVQTLAVCGGCGHATIRSDLDNSGTLIAAGNGLILDKTGGVYRNTGAINVTGTLTIPASAGSPSFTLAGGSIGSTATNPGNADFRMLAGTFHYTGGDALSTARGLVTIEGGDLVFGPSPSGTAAFSMLPSAAGNSFTGNIGATQTVRMPLVGGSQTMTSRTLTLMGDVVNEGTLEFQQSPSSGFPILAGTGTLTNKGTLISTGSGNDSLRIAINLRNEGTVTSNGRFLQLDQPALSYVNAGTIGGNGTLRVRGVTLTNEASGKLNITTELRNQARLRGTGTNGTSLRAFSGSMVDPGFSPGILTVGSLQDINGGILDLELGGDAPGTGYDQIQSAGQSTLSSGTLRVSAIDGFEAGKCGQVFDIIVHNSPGGIGTFSTVEGLDQGSGRTLKVIYGKPVVKLVGLDAGALMGLQKDPASLSEGSPGVPYYICLGQRPNTNVTVTPSADAQVTVSPASLTFTPTDWELPKAFTVTAVDDQAAEGPHGGRVTHTVASTDTRFNGFALGALTATIADNDVNTTPVAADDAAQTDEDTPVTVDVLANDSDPEGDPLTITSATASHGSASVVNGGTRIRYSPLANYNGADAIVYQITDGRGQSATGTVRVTVVPVADPPVAGADQAITRTRKQLAVKVLANDLDPDGGTLTVSQVTQPAHGSATITGAGQTVTYRSVAGYVGGDQFSYTVRNAGGATATATVSVTVLDASANTPPSAVDDNAQIKGAANQIRVAVLDNDSDPESDPLTLVSVTGPTNFGAATITGRTILYSKPVPSGNRNRGADEFTYTIRDSQGATATATVRVTWLPEYDVRLQSFNAGINPYPDPFNPTNVYIIQGAVWNSTPAGGMTLDFVLPAGATDIGQVNEARTDRVPHPNCSILTGGGKITYRCTITTEQWFFVSYDMPLNKRSFTTSVTLTPTGWRDPVPANNKMAIRFPADCTPTSQYQRVFSCIGH